MDRCQMHRNNLMLVSAAGNRPVAVCTLEGSTTPGVGTAVRLEAHALHLSAASLQ